uniref:Uncharacterized protein n=1 Tax=Eutreptiella gymnastica TaxID=73025 RepID=A0A7S4GG60_9EUGL
MPPRVRHPPPPGHAGRVGRGMRLIRGFPRVCTKPVEPSSTSTVSQHPQATPPTMGGPVKAAQGRDGDGGGAPTLVWPRPRQQSPGVESHFAVGSTQRWRGDAC